MSKKGLIIIIIALLAALAVPGTFSVHANPPPAGSMPADPPPPAADATAPKKDANKPPDFGLKTFIDAASGLAGKSNVGANQFQQVFTNIFNLMLGLSAAAAVLYGLIAAITILGAFGSEEKIENAKKGLIYVLIGLAVIALAFTIVNLVPDIINKGPDALK